MGTRSLVHIKDQGKTLVTLYRQYDGYPTGIGQDIKDALAKGKAKLTNGYSGKDKTPEVFNGMGCLAAYLIGALKNPPTEKSEGRNAIGNVYVQTPDAKDCGEEFTYTLDTPKDDEAVLGSRAPQAITLTVQAGNSVVYSGPLAKFNPKKLQEEIDE